MRVVLGWVTDAFACVKRLTVSMVDTFLVDLEDVVSEVKVLPSRNGTMVSLYGMSSILFLPLHSSHFITLDTNELFTLPFPLRWNAPQVSEIRAQ
jgi:hypothetical protein